MRLVAWSATSRILNGIGTWACRHAPIGRFRHGRVGHFDACTMAVRVPCIGEGRYMFVRKVAATRCARLEAAGIAQMSCSQFWCR